MAAFVVPISADASALVCRLAQGQRIAALSRDGHDIPVTARLRIIGQDHTIWILIVGRLPPLREIDLCLAAGSVALDPVTVAIGPVGWNNDLLPAVRQLVRYLQGQSRRRACDGLYRFLSVGARWGARVASAYGAEGLLLLRLSLGGGAVEAQAVKLFGVSETGIAALDGAAACIAGELLLGVPAGAWHSLFILWQGEFAQIDCGGATLRPWAALEQWAAAQPAGARGAFAALWSVLGKALPGGSFAALDLPRQGRLAVPAIALEVAAVVVAGSRTVLFASADGLLPDDVQIRLRHADGTQGVLAAARFSHPAEGPGGGRWRVAIAGTLPPRGEAEPAAVAVTLCSAGRTDQCWLAPVAMAVDDHWRLVQSWRPPALADDGYLRQVVLPCWHARHRAAPPTVVAIDGPGGAAGMAGDRVVVVAGDRSAEALHRTVIALSLACGGRPLPVLIVLTDPAAAAAVATAAAHWARCYGLAFAVAVPRHNCLPLAALAAALPLRGAAGKVLVLPAGAVPRRSDLAEVLGDGHKLAGDCHLALPQAPTPPRAGATAPLVDGAWCLALSAAAVAELCGITAPYGTLDSGLRALLSRLGRAGLAWRTDPRLATVDDGVAAEPGELRLDRLMLADEGAAGPAVPLLPLPAPGRRRRAGGSPVARAAAAGPMP